MTRYWQLENNQDLIKKKSEIEAGAIHTVQRKLNLISQLTSTEVVAIETKRNVVD
jgi:hypothetical protein